MSRLDDIERRLAALESGGGDGMAPRIKALEECLGLCAVPASVASSDEDLGECPRCKMAQNKSSVRRCPQGKCPFK